MPITKNIYLVFLKFNDSLLTENHSLNLLGSIFANSNKEK